MTENNGFCFCQDVRLCSELVTFSVLTTLNLFIPLCFIGDVQILYGKMEEKKIGNIMNSRFMF